MNTPTTSASDSGLQRRTLLRLLAGLSIAAVCIAALPRSGDPPGWRVVLLLWAGLGAAAVVRGLELRAWFGPALSLHQSQSLQAVIDFARWLSPLQDRRRFEAELIARETAEAPELIGEWSRSRQWWRVVLLPALPAIVATVMVPAPVIAIGCWTLTLVAAVVTSPQIGDPSPTRRRDWRRRHAGMIACALIGLLIEAAALAAVARMITSDVQAPAVAAALFVALGLARAVPVAPFGIGSLELLAVGSLWLVGLTGYGAMMLLVHATWVAMAAALGLIYLPRYKLSLADLFDRRLPSLLAQSRRPAAGWAAPDAGGSSAVDVTVAIPAYNERSRLPHFLPAVLAHLRQQPRSWEVIVADDGSHDGTGDYVAALAADEPRLRLIRRPRNGGKGRAVLDAVNAATGRYVLLADADGAIPIHELEALWDAVAGGAEIAIGSRAVPGTERVRRGVIRAVLGKSFYMLVNFLAVPGIGDTQCGFKLLRRDAARSVFRELGEHGWAFDVEVLYRAQMAGYRVVEVGVEVHDIAGSKLDPLRDTIRMFVSLFRIRARNAGFTGRTAQRMRAERDLYRLRDAA